MVVSSKHARFLIINECFREYPRTSPDGIFSFRRPIQYLRRGCSGYRSFAHGSVSGVILIRTHPYSIHPAVVWTISRPCGGASRHRPVADDSTNRSVPQVALLKPWKAASKYPVIYPRRVFPCARETGCYTCKGCPSNWRVLRKSWWICLQSHPSTYSQFGGTPVASRTRN